MNFRDLPRCRKSRTFGYSVGGCKVFLTVGEFDDGTPGEISLRVAKLGSTFGGLMDAFASMVSLGLQAGIPFEMLYDEFAGVRFEPLGWCDDPNVPDVESIIDYIFRKLRQEYYPAVEVAA